MESLFKKVIFLFTFNFLLFSMLLIGVQNSSNKRKVILLTNETVSLPTGFIVGISFISGSLLGGLIKTDFDLKK